MCTNILLNGPTIPGKDKPRLYVSARTMELPGYPTTAIYQVPRHQQFPLVRTQIKHPLHWRNSFGFVGFGRTMPEFELFPILADGMNEKGLSCAVLWHAGAEYPQESHGADNLNYSDFVSWVLGNFATVHEVEEVLVQRRVHIVGPQASGENPLYMPLHFIAIDQNGECLVVEFVEKVMRV